MAWTCRGTGRIRSPHRRADRGALARIGRRAWLDTVKINEVESSGGTPGDWVELINNGASAVDLSGWIVKDNDDTHVFTIPAGTSIAAGGY